MFAIGSYIGGTWVLWSSWKRVVSRSSAKFEYRSLVDSSTEITWLCSLFSELGIKCR